MEYKIISLFQLNKLKEYRLMYGNLLSVYELPFIDGWDFQTVRKVTPLVTVDLPKEIRSFKKFTLRSFRQDLVFKTSFNTRKSKGYEKTIDEGGTPGSAYYQGSHYRMSLRYNLDYREKVSFGFRMEKDPGEPMLIPSSLGKIKTPDLFSGFLHLKNLGPVKSLILGNYRVAFGYGLNLPGGSGIGGTSGMPGMANRIRPQSSVSESGFFRGAAICAGLGKFSLTGFASFEKIDGTSIKTDSLGKPISFSSVDKTGLHRTSSELAGRKAINEKVFGGFMIFSNNWLKTGLIAIYDQFSVPVAKSSRPYAIFGFSGKSNFVGGISATVWLPKIHVFNETSFSRNMAMSLLTGIEVMPGPGVHVYAAYRKIDVGYHELSGSGFISSGSNSGESGIRTDIRIELPKKWIIGLITDISHSLWATYDLKAPSDRNEVMFSAEKAWPKAGSVAFTFRYLESSSEDILASNWVCHPGKVHQYKARIEGRFETDAGFRFKTRIECNISHLSNIKINPGWLIFQDIEYSRENLKTKTWLRICFFDVPAYESRIYAYENDVLYDFTSFMHYGKGIRGIFLVKWTPSEWIDLWFRLSTVYYTNKKIGSGWDEIDGNRQNEIEIQARIRFPA
jgi:hypothetical protein